MSRQRLKEWTAKWWKEWRGTLFLIVFVIIPVKSSLADFNWVPTGSMNPTILEGDFIFVNKAAYDLRIPLTMQRIAHWSEPNRGDIVICFSPEDRTRLIKRVVGRPGDIVELHDNRLYINGEGVEMSGIGPGYLRDLSSELRQQYTFAMEDLGPRGHAIMTSPHDTAFSDFGPVRVPERHFFIMGDNRDNSRDSRVFGFVRRDLIVGRAVGIAASFNIKDKYQPRLNRFFSDLQ